MARIATNTGRFAPIALGLALVLIGGLSGCSILKAGPAPDAGFLPEPERMAEHRERAPFHKLWIEDGFREADYDSLFVAPVNTEHVLGRSTWAKINVRNFSVEKDVVGIADEFRTTVIDAFRRSPTNHLAVVDTPSDQTLVLELAITELVPSKAFLATIGLAAWAAPLEVGVPVGTAAAFAETGWMAIEGRVRVGENGLVVIMFADREQSKMRVVDLESITWYGNARESMRDWAQQFVVLANTPHDVKVEDSSGFALLPW